MENNQLLNISIDEKVCYNCKHRIWAVAIGQGVRCGNEFINGWPKPIPGLRKSCEAFEVSADIKRKLCLKKSKQFLLDSLSERIHYYASPKEKTIEEILNELNNLLDEREDSVGGINRIIKFQRGNVELTKEQELELIEYNNLKILIADVKALKNRANEN